MEDYNTSLGPAVCRICMCGETSIPYLGKQAGEPLISPCRCSGTMGLFHRSCLEHWLTLTRTTNCEICKFAFKIKKKSRSFTDYIRQKGYKKVRTEPDNRNPFVDVSFILVITPLAAIALYLCVRGATLAGQKYHYAFENRESDENGRNLEIRNETSMEFALFLFVAIVLFFAYMVFIVVTMGSHVLQYKRWQAKNMIMFVVDQLDAEQSLHYNPQWKKHNSDWKSLLSQAWRKVRGKPMRVLYPEIARNSFTQAPIEPIVGISPLLVANFNQTAVDSDNTHNHDGSRNAMPFGVRSPEQAQAILGYPSPPQMYTETTEGLALSPIGLDDLFANAMSPRRMGSSSTSQTKMRKSQSVYSVCSSFGTGVVSCSTPLGEQKVLKTSAPSASSFKTFCSTENVLMTCSDETEDAPTTESQRGRFYSEKIDMPRSDSKF
uniref:RING-CH-type domain-containing protein n=1 Tax=Caenorhabditis tropicalis TaxID=1561998 RepID=A0A1I7TTJ0_9PELO